MLWCFLFSLGVHLPDSSFKCFFSFVIPFFRCFLCSNLSQLALHYYRRFKLLTCMLESPKAHKGHCKYLCMDVIIAATVLICPVKTLKEIFIRFLCIKGLYFISILCFLGVTITFSFILGYFLFVFAQLLPPTSPSLPLNHHMHVAAFLILIIELRLEEWVQSSRQRHSCFTAFTVLSQLIFSLAGIFKRRGLSCNALHLAGVPPFASRCCLADAQHTCQMKPSDVSVAIIPFVSSLCECLCEHTNWWRELPRNLHLPGSNCFHVAL